MKNIANWEQKAKNILGVLQTNGDFIFVYDDVVNRNMVLTTNYGTIVKRGNLALPATNWEQSANWNTVETLRVTNFVGSKGKNKLIYCVIVLG